MICAPFHLTTLPPHASRRCHSNQARYDFGGKAAVRQNHAGWCPASFKKLLDLRSPKRPELMNEADTRLP
jgi:hypothetical protein